MGQVCGHLPHEQTLTDCPPDRICPNCAARLRHATADSREFTLNGSTATAKVVHVYDGDTIHVVLVVFDQLYKFKCRLAHIDTPEVKVSLKDPDRLLHKQAALVAKDYVSELIGNRVVRLRILKYDKYGRLLVEIYLPDGRMVNNLILEKGLAIPYGGRTKSVWTREHLQRIVGRSVITY